LKAFLLHTTKTIPVSLLLIGIVFFGCENDIQEVNRVTQHDNLPLQTITGSSITYTVDGRPSMKITAGRIDRYPNVEDPYDQFSEGIEVISFDSKGEVASTVTAERATNYTEREVMVAMDSVIVKDSEGKMLQTELLTWDKTTAKIFTDEFVKITTPTEILFGDGLEADQDFSKYEILNIKGRIKVDEDDDQDADEQTTTP
jgi:LPS export ABC transporter protein LptC